MQLGRLGSLIGFAIGCIGGGIQVTLPEYRIFGWALIATGVGTALISLPWWLIANYRFQSPLISRDRMQPPPLAPPDKPASDEKSNLMDATDGPEHERLDLFIVDHLRPTISAQFELQYAVLARVVKDKKILSFAEQGLMHDYDNVVFHQAFDNIQDFGMSPMPIVPVGTMIGAITAMESGAYKKFCDQAQSLADGSGLDIWRDSETHRLWDEWRLRHNAMVAEYDKLKRESRFGQPLYRPQLPSRWGGEIGPMPGPA